MNEGRDSLSIIWLSDYVCFLYVLDDDNFYHEQEDLIIWDESLYICEWEGRERETIIAMIMLHLPLQSFGFLFDKSMKQFRTEQNPKFETIFFFFLFLVDVSKIDYRK